MQVKRVHSYGLSSSASDMQSANLINNCNLLYRLLHLLVATTNQEGKRQDRLAYSEVWIQPSDKSSYFCAAQHHELINHEAIQCSTQQLHCIITWPKSSSFKTLGSALQATIHYHLTFNKKSGMFQRSFNGIRITCALKYLCLPWEGRERSCLPPPRTKNRLNNAKQSDSSPPAAGRNKVLVWNTQLFIGHRTYLLCHWVRARIKYKCHRLEDAERNSLWQDGAA